MRILGDRRTEEVERGVRDYRRQVELQECLALSGDRHERYVRRSAGCRVDGFGTYFNRDGLDEAATVGFEELVQRPQRHLVDCTEAAWDPRRLLTLETRME